jgi:hypothetical protein
MMKRMMSIIIFYLVAIFTLNAAEKTTTKTVEPKKETKTQTQTQPQTVPIVNYEIIEQGTYTGLREAFAKVITNSKDWEDLWKKHVSVLVPQPPLPEVDFNDFVIVAIFSGEKRTSGYQIVLKDVAFEADNVMVRYHESQPPENSFTLQVLTQPHLVLKIEKPKGAVQLVKE